MCSLRIFRAIFLTTLVNALINIPVHGVELGIPTPIVGTSFERRMIVDETGRKITYYISRPKTIPAPLMMMIQGSGCIPVINEQQGRAYSTVFDMLPFGQEGLFTVVVVEKPFSGTNEVQNAGAGQTCSAAFNDDFTADSWLRALRASLQDARKSPWVDQKRTLVFGHSEGAVMATMLAANDDRITDVVAIGASGTTQLYDFIVHAYHACFDVPRCLADVERNARAIVRNPNSSTDFAWGHPFKRWTSFFRVDPSEELLHSKARVYIAFGTADNAVPALSQEISVAKLLIAGRDITVRRIPDADHGLRLTGATDFSDTDKEYRAALNWFWEVDSNQLK
jgi:pimeloyl-ACP methyl ester carboxylesterase